MGNCGSKTKVDNEEDAPTANLGTDFTDEDWGKAHNSGDCETCKNKLNSKGVNLQNAKSLPRPSDKSVFICCNSYEKPEYSLGVGPINDSISVGTYLAKQGFKIYFAHNPTSSEYKKYIKHFVENTKSVLVCYYTGHGSSITDGNHDEVDGKDEAVVFDDDVVLDDELAEILSKCNKPEKSKCVMINDCCHSGTIWELDSNRYRKRKTPNGIISMAASSDDQTSKQTSIGGKDQGIFTYYFFTILGNYPKITPNEMKEKIEEYISRFNQTFTVFSTSPELKDSQIFAPMK
ncbi:Clan CD, family C14, metacaspase-like cysteine peptidase [Tritrichomonas foetus]|uniref:Clan CD, family C14, metacaspase-like cysteine peptidase n=1 Tax=Tritrichomonas foetus TaxID=1144522 RepID=A0A1J4KDF4_9EUKA|nr:Clan CD, family C14, metacaspase-like cysteine peptidase [Tritrichomonas foetus]|eukprot:OHT07748.1 Clan CD, family C14, metacaspase-like cysteine peptidase [Tritrichomonas foetus]